MSSSLRLKFYCKLKLINLFQLFKQPSYISEPRSTECGRNVEGFSSPVYRSVTQSTESILTSYYIPFGFFLFFFFFFWLLELVPRLLAMSLTALIPGLSTLYKVFRYHTRNRIPFHIGLIPLYQYSSRDPIRYSRGMFHGNNHFDE
jgi:hypothetical protein